MDQARVVVIGGGITGCSVALHLARAGWTDVLLLDKGPLTSGSTSQAAGLVTMFNPSATMMRFRRYSIELYRELGVFCTARSGPGTSPSTPRSDGAGPSRPRAGFEPDRNPLWRDRNAACGPRGCGGHVGNPLVEHEPGPRIQPPRVVDRSRALAGPVPVPGDGKVDRLAPPSPRSRRLRPTRTEEPDVSPAAVPRASPDRHRAQPVLRLRRAELRVRARPSPRRALISVAAGEAVPLALATRRTGSQAGRSTATSPG